MVATMHGLNGTGVKPLATTTLKICVTAKGATLCANSGQSPARSFPVAQVGENVSFRATWKNVGSVPAENVNISYGSASASRLETIGDMAPGAEIERIWSEPVTPGPPPEAMAWIAACGVASNAEDGCAWLAPWIGTPPATIPPIGGGGGGLDTKMLLLLALGAGAVYFFSQYEFVRE